MESLRFVLLSRKCQGRHWALQVCSGSEHFPAVVSVLFAWAVQEEMSRSGPGAARVTWGVYVGGGRECQLGPTEPQPQGALTL